MDVALRLLAEHAELRQLVDAMVTAVRPLAEGVEAIEQAATKGVLKVQLLVGGS